MTKDSSRPSHANVHKIDNASVQKHVRWIFVIFYLFNLAQLKYKTMYIKYLGRETTVVLLVTDGLDSCNLSHCSPGVRHYIHIHTECHRVPQHYNDYNLARDSGSLINKN